jgi:hypothetical protein
MGSKGYMVGSGALWIDKDQYGHWKIDAINLKLE